MTALDAISAHFPKVKSGTFIGSILHILVENFGGHSQLVTFWEQTWFNKIGVDDHYALTGGLFYLKQTSIVCPRPYRLLVVSWFSHQWA